MEGVVLAAKPDGTCLAEMAFTPQTADQDGDYARTSGGRTGLTRPQPPYGLIELDRGIRGLLNERRS